uniref:Uncharacterized protein n=1 Tax=Rhizophora mucronata TaxID=61149 RepID=A0A2P2P729_RHIMU
MLKYLVYSGTTKLLEKLKLTNINSCILLSRIISV